MTTSIFQVYLQESWNSHPLSCSLFKTAPIVVVSIEVSIFPHLTLETPIFINYYLFLPFLLLWITSYRRNPSLYNYPKCSVPPFPSLAAIKLICLLWSSVTRIAPLKSLSLNLPIFSLPTRDDSNFLNQANYDFRMTCFNRIVLVWFQSHSIYFANLVSNSYFPIT